ncbi:hypothetical protein [Enterocloster clostridioformis]|uniref:hypothetical protein n=2 Tax=Enterocloster clostridioformis TaxID=1531 RepID=UPI00140CFA74|nr:hypothetical protein [Enterocloster clostridioformis]
MVLARKVVSEGVIISRQNQLYQGVNLYTWYCKHKDRFTDEELIIMNKLIQNSQPVKIIDYKTNKVLNVSSSISQAAKVLCHDFNIGTSEKGCVNTISRHLTGKVKNPVYKGRFIFQYADSEDQSEPA